MVSNSQAGATSKTKPLNNKEDGQRLDDDAVQFFRLIHLVHPVHNSHI